MNEMNGIIPSPTPQQGEIILYQPDDTVRLAAMLLVMMVGVQSVWAV